MGVVISIIIIIIVVLVHDVRKDIKEERMGIVAQIRRNKK